MEKPGRLTSQMVEAVMQGRALKSGSFLFKFIPFQSQVRKNTYFIGFIAPKKNFKKATERTRARRRGRAAFLSAIKELLTDKNIKPIIGAFVLNKSAGEIDFKDLISEIQQTLIKSGILVKP